MTYVLVIIHEKEPFMPDIETDEVKIYFVKVGQAVHGRHWRGNRINVVVNRSSIRNFECVTDERLADWWRHVKTGLAKGAKIYDGIRNERVILSAY